MEIVDNYISFEDLYIGIIDKKSTRHLDTNLVYELLSELANRCNKYFRNMLPNKIDTEEDEKTIHQYRPFRIRKAISSYESGYPDTCILCNNWIQISDYIVYGQIFKEHYCSTCFISKFYGTEFGKIPVYFTHWNFLAEVPVNLDVVLEKADEDKQTLLGINPIFLTVTDILNEIVNMDIPNTQLPHHQWAMWECLIDYTYSSPKANKFHYCSVENCGKIILPNEYYFSISSPYDYFYRLKMCGHCFATHALNKHLIPIKDEFDTVWSVFQNKSVYLSHKYDIEEYVKQKKRSEEYEKRPRKIGDARKRELFHFVWDAPIEISAEKIGRKPRSLAAEARNYGIHIPKPDYWNRSEEIRDVVRQAFFELYFGNKQQE